MVIYRKMRDRVSANFIWIMLFMLLLGGFLIGMPKYLDDHIYLIKFSDWFFKQGIYNPEGGGNFIMGGFPWEEIKETWRARYAYDNVRFGNIIVVFFLLLPKWIGSGIAWLCCIWIFIAGMRLARIDIYRSALVALGLFLFGVCMPWRQHMGSMDYQFNYIVPTALQFLLLLQLLQKENHSNQWKKWTGVFLTGFLSGGWQEALSIPVVCGLVFISLMHKECRRSVTYWGIGGVILGILWIIAAPGQWVRVSHTEIAVSSKLSFEYAIRTLVSTWMFWVFAGLMILQIIGRRKDSKRIKRIFRDVRLQFMLVSGFVSVGIVVFTYADARVGWWATVCGIFGVLYLLRKYHHSYWRSYTSRNILAASIFLILAFSHRIIVDYDVVRIRRSFLDSIEAYNAHPDEPVFVEMGERSIGTIFGNISADEIFIFGTWGATDYYGNRYRRKYNAIPKALENITSATARKIPGNSGLMEFEGHFLMPVKEERTSVDFIADYGSGKEMLEGYLAPFKSRGDGKDYYYVYLCQNWYDHYFRKLKRVDMAED